jgi:hypothetical protein
MGELKSPPGPGSRMRAYGLSDIWIGGGGEIRTRGPRSGRRFSRPFLRQEQQFNDNSWLAINTCSFVVICHFHYFSYFAHFADFPPFRLINFIMVLKQNRVTRTAR